MRWLLLIMVLLVSCSEDHNTTDVISGSGDATVESTVASSISSVTFDSNGKPIIKITKPVKPSKPVINKPNSKTPTVNPSPTPTPNPTPVPSIKKETGTSLGTFTSYGTRNGGRQAWRIPKKGPQFGPSIKVVFEDGHTVYVRNTSKNYRESDGFVFKPGIGPNGEGQENTGTSHGGVYLHAPYGNRSKTVTFYSL